MSQTEANLVANYDCQSQGISWTRVIPGNKVLVRQGSMMTRIAFATQKVDATLDMGLIYDKQPIAIMEQYYIEVHHDKVLKVQFADVSKKEETPLPVAFPAFDRPAWVQFQGVLMIQNKAKLYLFKLEDLTYIELADLPAALDDALLIHPDQEHIHFFWEGEQFTYVAETMEFTRKPFSFNGTGKFGMLLNAKEFVSTNGNCIVKVNLETGAEEIVFSGSSLLDGCLLNPAGIYIVFTDQNGKGHIIGTPLAKLMASVRCGFNLKQKPTQTQTAHDVPKESVAPVLTAPLPTKGPSWSTVMNENAILIRQGEKLTQVEFATQKIKCSADMRAYELVPMAVLENTFYEIRGTILTKVDLGTFNVEDVILDPVFPEMFQSPAFLQFGDHVIIQNLTKIFSFDLKAATWKEISLKPSPVPIVNAMILVPSSSAFWFIAEGQRHQYDTKQGTWTSTPCKFKGTGCEGHMVEDDSFIAVSGDELLSCKLEGEPAVLHKGKMMSDCVACFASQYMVIANQEGEMVVLESQIFEKLQQHRPQIEFKYK